MSHEVLRPSLNLAPGLRWRSLLQSDIAVSLLQIRSFAGFVLAGTVLFLILAVLPLPAGLSAQGKATLAIMAWAAIIWIFEALPVAVSGLLIPMLLMLTNAVTPLALMRVLSSCQVTYGEMSRR